MHKTLLSIITSCILCLQIHAQQKITLAEVNKHIGDSVIVCGKSGVCIGFQHIKQEPVSNSVEHKKRKE